MDFDLSPEQEMLSDAARRFVASQYSFEQRRAILASAPRGSRDVWRRLGELGMTGLLVPEEHGGVGAGPVETMLVMEAFGAAMLLEPFWASAVVATQLLAGLKGPVASRLLGALACGELVATVAHTEPGVRQGERGSDGAPLETVAEPTPVGWCLTGAKSLVLQADIADVVLVSARSPARGVSIFAVPRSAGGVGARTYPLFDGRAVADLSLSSVALPNDALVGGEGSASAALDDAYDVGLAALCADAVGAMKALLDATAHHLQTRRQFGQPLSHFQVLRHRIADMLIHYEQARSMTILAALRCRTADVVERRRALSAAKVVVGEAGRFIGQQAVQLHGGMGMSDELCVSHLFKRLTAAELLVGDIDHHVERFVSLSARLPPP